MAPTEADAYILGTDRVELERLRVQHQAWLKQGLDLWRDAGLGGGQHVLDLGCGPGYTSLALADVVGPEGRVTAVDRSAGFVETLRREAERLGWNHLHAVQGDVEQLDIETASLDAAYARWLLCWLDDPAPLIEHAARMLKPGGCLVFQEYLHWAAFRLVPEHPAHDAAVRACMRSWPLGGADIDVARRLPELGRRCGLELELFRPIARVGKPGSFEWRWVFGFFESYLPRLVERGLLDEDARVACMAAITERAADPDAHVLAPVMADVVLRKR